MKKKGGRQWKHRTNEGVVVYKRPKHEMKILDVINMLLRMTQHEPQWFIKGQQFQCNAVTTIAITGFYPYWLDAIQYDLTTSGRGDLHRLWNYIKGEVYGTVKIQVADICQRIGSEIGIPRSVRDFVIDNFYDKIWDAVWGATDYLFGGKPPGESRIRIPTRSFIKEGVANYGKGRTLSEGL